VAIGGEAEAEGIAARLRAGEPKVVGRIQDGRVVLDARTVLEGEDEGLMEAVVGAVLSAPASLP
jgi:L-seryl-tRNA(Ser) seleniumtransferase